MYMYIYIYIFMDKNIYYKKSIRNQEIQDDPVATGNIYIYAYVRVYYGRIHLLCTYF
jgi:hypothetical protein